MDLNLNKKSALVTGASYGLGFACAEALVGEGVHTTICSRNQSNLERAAAKLRDQGEEKISTFAANLKKEADLDRLIDHTKANPESFDILVISTGHPPTYSFDSATDELWREGYSLLLNPVIKLTRAFLPGMRKRGYGRIIYIGSIFGLEPEPSSVIQSTFRTGLNSFMKCIATAEAPHGITANVICPGYFSTPLVNNLAQKYAEERGVSVDTVLDEWKKASPCQKFGRPEDLGALVAFLSSPRGEFINGTTIVADGGAIRTY